MGRWSGAFRVLCRLSDLFLRLCLARALINVTKLGLKIFSGVLEIRYPSKKQLPAGGRGDMPAGRQWVAILSVILLILWQMLAVQSVRAGDISSHLDAFGNSLCINTTDNEKVPEEHKTLPICCIAGCQIVVGITPAEPEPACLRPRLIFTDAESKPEHSVQRPPRDQQPYGPRAPPTAHARPG